MMLIHCSTCGRSELGGYRALQGVRNTPTGVEMVLRCRAGHEVVETTGRRRRPAPVT